MTSIRISAVLRASNDGAKHVTIEGGKVREVIDRILAAHPRTAGQLRTGQLRTANGELNRSSTSSRCGTCWRSTRRSGIATRWSCCRRWRAAEAPR